MLLIMSSLAFILMPAERNNISYEIIFQSEGFKTADHLRQDMTGECPWPTPLSASFKRENSPPTPITVDKSEEKVTVVSSEEAKHEYGTAKKLLEEHGLPKKSPARS